MPVFKIRKARSLRVGLSDTFSKRFYLHHFSVSENVNKKNLLHNYFHKFTFVIEEFSEIRVCAMCLKNYISRKFKEKFCKF